MDLNRIIGELIEGFGIKIIGGGIAVYLAYSVAVYVAGAFHQVSAAFNAIH